MPTLEEILANANFGDDESETPAPEPEAAAAAKEKSNSAIKQVRDYANKMEREKKKLEAELEELRSFKAAQVEKERTSALSAAGLSPRQSEAFLKMYEEVTEDNVTAFKAEVLGVGELPPPAPQFQPTGTPGEPDRKLYSREQFEDIMRTDPVRGRQIMAANLVQWNRDTSATPL